MKKAARTALLVLLGAAILAPVLRAQEQDVERLLAQADAQFEKGDFKSAISTYLEAAALGQNAMNLSRAYFGLSLAYFTQGDSANSVKWMRKVVEVDPAKEISELFYPQNFVDLFRQVRREVRAKPAAAPPATAAAERTLPAADARRPAPPSLPKVAGVQAGPELGFPGGRFELSVHYSSWSVNLLKGAFEGSLVDKLGEEIQNEINKAISSSHGLLTKAEFSQSLAFDSPGSNYGFELRYYARGRAGTFSLGFSLEKTHIKLALAGKARQTFTNGGVAEATANAAVETSPFSTNFSFRWEMGRAEARVKPYFTFGLGLAPLKGTFSYDYIGTYTYASLQESIQGNDSETFVELSERIDFKIPELLVILQLSFGLKVEVVHGLFVLGEAGIWDGFLLRGGIGYRF